MHVQQNTARAKILLAAHALEEIGCVPFTAEDLVVAAFEADPDTFGLRGHSKYPDSNKTLSPIMGTKGMVAHGLLYQHGQKLYSLSDHGRAEAERLLAPTAKDLDPDRATVNATWDGILRRIFDVCDLRKDEPLTPADAFKFWGIQPGDCGEQVDVRLAHVERTLRGTAREIGARNLVLTNGREAAPEEIADLQELSAALIVRFTRHLSILRSRQTVCANTGGRCVQPQSV